MACQITLTSDLVGSDSATVVEMRDIVSGGTVNLSGVRRICPPPGLPVSLFRNAVLVQSDAQHLDGFRGSIVWVSKTDMDLVCHGRVFEQTC